MTALFVYGSLMSAKVLDTIIGRVPETLIPSVLPNYHRYKVKGEIYPAITAQANDQVDGLLIPDITVDEIERLDHFEGDEYDRIVTQVRSKLSNEFIDCYVYVWNSSPEVLYGTWSYKKDFLPKEEKFINNFPYFIHGMGEDL